MLTMVRHISVVLIVLAVVAAPSARADETAPSVGLHSFTPAVTAFTGARIAVSPGKIIDNAVLCYATAGRGRGVGVAIPMDRSVRDCAVKNLILDHRPTAASAYLVAVKSDESGPLVHGTARSAEF